MKNAIRIIETGYALGGRLAHVYVFCLPPAAIDRLEEVREPMRHGAPEGVEQFVMNDAGLLIYTRERADNVGTCRGVSSVINSVLHTGLELDPKTSFFFVRDYGRWEGATTYAMLQQNPRFVLPYMK